MILRSRVRNFQGPCAPTWLNKNSICYRVDGGATGFFRRVKRVWKVFVVKYGPEFHGIIRGGEVHTTELPGL